jgi:AraC-like DNA-binding protein
MQKAEVLLRTTFLTIKEVANLVGLSDSHFVRDFQLTYGLSPTVFRRRNRMANKRKLRNGE